MHCSSRHPLIQNLPLAHSGGLLTLRFVRASLSRIFARSDCASHMKCFVMDCPKLYVSSRSDVYSAQTLRRPCPHFQTSYVSRMRHVCRERTDILITGSELPEIIGNIANVVANKPDNWMLPIALSTSVPVVK